MITRNDGTLPDSGNHLTPEEVWLFRRNGFVVAPRKLSPQLISDLNEETDRQIEEGIEPLVRKEDPVDPSRVFVNRVSDLLQRSQVYLEAATDPAVLGPLADVLGPNVDLLTNWHNHLMVRPGGSPRIKWHRGAAVYSPMLVTVLIYLSESTLENGCVRVVPGSHVSPFRSPYHLVDEESREAAKKVPFREHIFYRLSVPIPMPAGGILLFSDAVYHGADVNRTPSDRRSMTLAYMAHDDHATSHGELTRVRVLGSALYRGLGSTPEEDLRKSLSPAMIDG